MKLIFILYRPILFTKVYRPLIFGLSNLLHNLRGKLSINYEYIYTFNTPKIGIHFSILFQENYFFYYRFTLKKTSMHRILNTIKYNTNTKNNNNFMQGT